MNGVLWSDSDIEVAKAVLGKHLQAGAEARAEISAALGRDVSVHSLANAFFRRGLGRPKEWCGRTPVRAIPPPPPTAPEDVEPRAADPFSAVDLSALDYDNDEDTVPQRRTPAPTTEPTRPLESAILYGDIHAPFHDEPAVSLALEVSRVIDPSYVVVMGDAWDAYCISDHDKDPMRGRDVETECGEAIRVLKRIVAAAPNARRRIYCEGNHEYRLTRYLQRRAPELYSLHSVRQLLRLDELGFEWVPYRSSTRIGKLNLTHEVGNAGAYAHIKALAAFEDNIAIGHTHRLSIAYGGSVAGQTHVGAMLGWLGSFEAVDYMHKANMRNWQHGVGVGYVESDGVVHLQAVPFIHGRAVVNGRLITAA